MFSYDHQTYSSLDEGILMVPQEKGTKGNDGIENNNNNNNNEDELKQNTADNFGPLEKKNDSLSQSLSNHSTDETRIASISNLYRRSSLRKDPLYSSNAPSADPTSQTSLILTNSHQEFDDVTPSEIQSSPNPSWTSLRDGPLSTPSSQASLSSATTTTTATTTDQGATPRRKVRSHHVTFSGSTKKEIPPSMLETTSHTTTSSHTSVSFSSHEDGDDGSNGDNGYNGKELSIGVASQSQSRQSRSCTVTPTQHQPLGRKARKRQVRKLLWESSNSNSNVNMALL